MRSCPVVITGVGAATPLGANFDTFAKNLLAGNSPARTITDSAAGVEVSLPACLAAEPPVSPGWEEAAFRALPRTEQFVLWCCSSALADAGLCAEDGPRIGLALGAGGEWIRRWEGDWAAGGRE